jgi:hypothetical protein
MKRILALVGVFLLVGMYIATFVFAMIDSPTADSWFRASIFCTITIPVFLYGYQLIYRYLKNRKDK